MTLTEEQEIIYKELKKFYSIAFKQGSDKRHATFYALNRYTNNVIEIDKFEYKAVQKFLAEVV